MKKFNGLLMAAAAVLTVHLEIVPQAGELSTLPNPPSNKALLASPRYLEEHPELLRQQRSVGGSSGLNPAHLAIVSENSALTQSPRFREEHPELRWVMPSAQEAVARDVTESDRMRKLTDNKALAASPRFREEHPEILHGELRFEIAPLK